MPGSLRPPIVERLEPSTAEGRQRRVAGSLEEAGLGPGDRVAFSLGSSADLLCAALGATRRGVVPVMLNATLTPWERDRLLEDCRPALVVSSSHDLSRLGAGPEVELSPRPLTRPMHYTSGTTGRPKGVWSGVWDEETATAVFDDEADLWGFGPDDVHLVCSPMYHSVSLRFAGATLLRGGSCLVLSRFDADTAISLLRRERPTTAFLVPSHLRRIHASPELEAEERWGSLRLLAHAGEPCPPALKRAVMARCAEGTVWEFYGSTEGQFTVCSPDEWRARPGTVGRARPGRVLRIDPAVTSGGGAVPAEERAAAPGGSPGGTIWCEAPSFARFEYWGAPEATAAAWRDGAFTVGDLGHLDPDGFLYFSGRREDLIISGGVNVYPAEVEAALREAPGVSDVAVFALPDERWGQRVCAAVVAEAAVSDERLRALAAERLAPYKRPKQYERTAELPYTATGKLRRAAVAELLGLG